eukprot:8648175-Pyramimonas_sp.AAC.1
MRGERVPSPRGNGRHGWTGGGRGLTFTARTSGFDEASSHQPAGAIPKALSSATALLPQACPIPV